MIEPHFRYGEFLSAVRRKQRAVSYNEVYAFDLRNKGRSKLRLIDLHRLLTPYFGTRLGDQLRAVLPLALFLAAFLVIALRTGLSDGDSILFGLAMVMVGLMFFMEGVKHGLMPFSENIGYALPGRSHQLTVLAFACVLGAAATLAEPAIGALSTAASGVPAGRAPLLFSLLSARSGWLVAAVAIGVGLAVAVGMLRYYYAWELRWLVLIVLAPCLSLTAYAGANPALAPVVGLAWDCGAITTGPVTVPLVLATGIGVAAATGHADNPLSGFGIVTLASLFPAAAVLILGIGLQGDIAPGEIAASAPVVASWLNTSPTAEIIAALQAIVPLVLMLWLVQRWIVGAPLQQAKLTVYGVLVAIVGMALFNLGLTEGLVPLGQQAGRTVPAAFVQLGAVTGSPLYGFAVGVGVALAFAAALGYSATIAEPALNAIGITVEDLTDGAFPKRLLIQTVATGVAAGMIVGVVKLIFNLPMTGLILASYGVAAVLTLISSEEYVNLAWDCAGVTTGPVTVPLVLALGLGLGAATGATEGFGILAMASVGPIVSVLAVGLWIRYRRFRLPHRKAKT